VAVDTSVSNKITRAIQKVQNCCGPGWFSIKAIRVFPAQRRARLNDARHHKIIEPLKFDISSTIEALEAGLSSLELSDSVNYSLTAKEYGVNPITSRRRHKGKQVSRHQAAFKSKSLFIDT
jgi:hypothetical protein